MDGEPAYERRIGARTDVGRAVTLEWGGPRPRGVLDRRRWQPTATLVDVSVSGAAVEAPVPPEVAVGEVLPVRLRVASGPGGPGDGGAVDATGTVRVVRVQPVGGGVYRYGVEFDRLDPELREALHAIAGSGRPDEELRRYWNTAV